MDYYERKKLILKHGNYKYTFMNEDELRAELKNWCRQDLINWLKWNDRNGIYDDEQSMAEIGNILSYEEDLEIMVKQLVQN